MSIHEGNRARIRQQLKTSGMDSLSDVQVLELLLYYAIPRQDTNPIAHALLARFGSLSGVLDASQAELVKIDGVGESAAALIKLVPQLERRCLISRSENIQILNSTAKCGRYLVPFFHAESEELVYLLCLDAKCKLIDCVQVHHGDVNVAPISVRKIVKLALDLGATSVVLAHNHPAGIALPSQEDHATTLLVKKALQAVNVTLVDHLIVADDDYVSMASDGLL